MRTYKKSTLNRFHFVFNVIWKSAHIILLCYFILTVFSGLFEAFSIKYIGKSFDNISIKSQNDINLFVKYIIIFLFFRYIAPGITSIITSLLLQKINYVVQIYITDIIMDKCSKISLEEIENSKYQDILQLICGMDKRFLVSYVLNMIGIFYMFIKASALIIILWNYHPLISVIIIISAAIDLVFRNYNSKIYEKYRLNSIENVRKMDYNMGLFFNKESIIDIKINAAFDFFKNKYNNIFDKYLHEMKKYAKGEAKRIALADIIKVVITTLMKLIIMYLVIKKIITIGAFVAFLTSFGLLINYYDVFIYNYSEKNNKRSFINLTYKFLYETKEDSNDNEIFSLEKINKIIFKNVYYRYPSSLDNILKDINFEINKGECYAIVGENGTGKSTLVRLISNLVKPTNGEIVVNDHNMKEIVKENYRDKISIINQDVSKYYFKIWESIGISNIERIYDSEEIKKSSLKARIDFINKMPYKFEQQLGNDYSNGIEVSGGQWKKIALARSYFKQGEICIYDEPTAELDAFSENEVFLKMKDEKANKISFFITHRLGTTILADKILFLKNGRIVESGTHFELMEKQGEYAILYKLQEELYKIKDIGVKNG